MLITTIFRIFVTLPPSLIGFNTTFGIPPFFLLMLNPRVKVSYAVATMQSSRVRRAVRVTDMDIFIHSNSAEEIASNSARDIHSHRSCRGKHNYRNIPMNSNTIFKTSVQYIAFRGPASSYLVKIAILSETFFMHRHVVKTRCSLFSSVFNACSKTLVRNMMHGREAVWKCEMPIDFIQLSACGWNIKLRYLVVLNFGCVANYYYWFYQHRACLHANNVQWHNIVYFISIHAYTARNRRTWIWLSCLIICIFAISFEHIKIRRN